MRILYKLLSIVCFFGGLFFIGAYVITHSYISLAVLLMVLWIFFWIMSHRVYKKEERESDLEYMRRMEEEQNFDADANEQKMDTYDNQVVGEDEAQASEETVSDKFQDAVDERIQNVVGEETEVADSLEDDINSRSSAILESILEEVEEEENEIEDARIAEESAQED